MPCDSAETASAEFQQMLFHQYDWVWNCQVQVYPDYLDYQGSTAKGLVTFKISYRTSPESDANPALAAPTDYEELSYQNGRCVGLRRRNDLRVRPNTQGAIYFLDQGNDSLADHARETANAAVRLVLDARTRTSMIAGMVVPETSFEFVVSSLADLGFVPIEKARPQEGERPSVHLIGYPKGKERYLFYDPL
jgi:hypothetical protein